MACSPPWCFNKLKDLMNGVFPLNMVWNAFPYSWILYFSTKSEEKKEYYQTNEYLPIGFLSFQIRSQYFPPTIKHTFKLCDIRKTTQQNVHQDMRFIWAQNNTLAIQLTSLVSLMSLIGKQKDVLPMGLEVHQHNHYNLYFVIYVGVVASIAISRKSSLAL